jgi:predicted XRE-type DNA-binding protein
MWDAIEDTPAAAENLKLRSALMIALKERRGWTQAEAACRFGVTPRVSDLMPGRIDLFGLDTLVNMAARREQWPGENADPAVGGPARGF